MIVFGLCPLRISSSLAWNWVWGMGERFGHQNPNINYSFLKVKSCAIKIPSIIHQCSIKLPSEFHQKSIQNPSEFHQKSIKIPSTWSYPLHFGMTKLLPGYELEPRKNQSVSLEEIRAIMGNFSELDAWQKSAGCWCFFFNGEIHWIFIGISTADYG